MKRLLYLYPVLVAVFLVVSFFNSNRMGSTSLGSLFPALLVAVAITILTICILRLLLRSWGRASLVTLLVVLVVLVYGRLPHQEFAIYYLAVGGFLIACGIAFVVKVATPIGLIRLTKVLSIAFTCLVVVVSVNLVLAEMRYSKEFQAHRDSSNLPQLTPNEMPDVYYIYTDEYASGYVLSRFLNCDNSPFLNELRDRGFVVMDEGHCNYRSTIHSLGATFNLDYNDYSKVDRRGVYVSLLDHNVGKMFKAMGYKYIHIGSWFGPTSGNRNADYSYAYRKNYEFSQRLLGTLTTHPTVRGWFGNLIGDAYLQEFVPHQFDRLLEIPSMEEKTFTLMCLAIPHKPFIFGVQVAGLSEEERYCNQIQYVNGKFLEFLDVALGGDNPPIIIIQSDHGSRLGMAGRDNFDPEVVQRRFGILNVMYFPGLDITEAELPSTPVNTFRFLFNAYCGGEYEILEERSYYAKNSGFPTDITEIWNNYQRNGEE